MEKKIYITEEERAKCQKVADAFAELYEMADIAVVDAGRYGFVMLKYYKPPHGFEDEITFTDSVELFEGLWEEWLNTKLYLLARLHCWRKVTKVYLRVCQEKNSFEFPHFLGLSIIKPHF